MSDQQPGPGEGALPSHLRPVDPTTIHTDELPETPTRDRSIPASAWVEAPAELLALDDARYLRRIGPWLLWRAGDARGPATYWTCLAEHLDVHHTFELFADGTGAGRGPTADHVRFRTWKEDLRDHPDPRPA
ncbi:MAG: hypothetical protein U0P45_06010 [Acidimicrobiales bacterium]